MDLKLLLGEILILLMAGTICTLLSGIFQYGWIPSEAYPHEIPSVDVPYAYAYLDISERGFPFEWVSHWEIEYYQEILEFPHPPLRTIESWSFIPLNFMEDVLLYSLLFLLLSIYVDWRKKPEYPKETWLLFSGNLINIERQFYSSPSGGIP